MNKSILSILLALIILFNFSAAAQKKKKYSIKNKKAIAEFEKALRFYEGRKDYEAFKQLEKATAIDSDFIEGWILQARIMYDAGDYEKSSIFFKKAIQIDPKFTTLNYYNLAKSELKLGKYDECLQNIKLYAEDKKTNPIEIKRAQSMKTIAEFGANAIKNPVPFDPKNLGEAINSKLDEYHPSISSDNNMLIITRKLPDGSGRNDPRAFTEDFFVSFKNKDNSWNSSFNLGAPINTSKKEGAQSISPDGQWLFFTACYREDSKGSCDLYISHREGNKWGKPRNLGFPINSSKWDAQPSMSSDGKTLYFSSGRNGGKGGADIWQTVQNRKGVWSKPISLDFNTRGDEMAPFIHPDGKTMYFSSTGLLGMGGHDIFMVKKDKYGEFGTPINIGYPINTMADEHGMVVDVSGNLAYFASGRKGGFGGLDIYQFELYDAAKPNKVTFTKGKVYDSKNKEPLEAKFELIDLESGEIVVQSFSNKTDGGFIVCVPMNKDYALNAQVPNYLFYSENFSIESTGNGKPFYIDVPMKKVVIGNSVVLKNVFFETAKFNLKPKSITELDRLVFFLKNNLNLKIEVGGHTDNIGNKNSNQILSENRAKAVQDYLINKNINVNRLTYKGYGDTKPIATNNNESGRAQNRRTEFTIVADSDHLINN